MSDQRTLLKAINEKYFDDDDPGEFFGDIVFLNSSPITKNEFFPPIITLCDYGIEIVGHFGLSADKLANVTELDLTDNKLSDWSQILLILKKFPSLKFLNLAYNSFKPPDNQVDIDPTKKTFGLNKLILNGNPLINNWRTVNQFTEMCPYLEELHLSKNEFEVRENDSLSHSSLLYLYMSRNPKIRNLQLLLDSLSGVSSLKSLSLSDCSISEVPSKAFGEKTIINYINLSGNPISTWEEIEKLRDFKHLTELRIQGCPFSDGYPTKERRMLLVARLPNIRILNGGDRIPVDERENYERSFVRYFFDTRHCERPSRWQELVNVHGNLQPLVNVDLAPKTSLSLKIVFGEQERLDVINLYQTVGQFKHLCSGYFNIKVDDFRVFYINQETFEHCGAEEMRLMQKELYTYNIQPGDSFMVQEKYQKSVSMPEGMRRRRRTSSSSKSFSYSPKNKETQKESPGTTPPRRKYAQVHLLSKNNNPMGTPVS
uniref:Uncharacterized protein n=1 Tax=Lepeophtheirus salmonis TaxID=72036 RepID=A0A0K2UDV7_LEPSM